MHKIYITFADGCHQTMTISSAFFQADRQKGKIVNTPQQKAMDIFHDFKAQSIQVYQNEKEFFSFSIKNTNN